MHAIITSSWLQITLDYKPLLKTNLLENKEINIKSIQAIGYNGVHTVRIKNEWETC